jgi:transposase
VSSWKKELEHQLKDNRDFQHLQQVPGIGPILALTILAEAGDLRRFGHHRQFLKFCGLDLSSQQSGQFRGVTKLSKYGNARLRCAFWMAATIAVRQTENSFRDKFERYIRRDPASADRKPGSPVTGLRHWVEAHGLCRSRCQDGARDLRDHQDRSRVPLLP